jgi:co-chaperonin GroES (HSP10)
MKIRPLYGHCLISPDPPSTESKGGILYPNRLQETAHTGFVHLHELAPPWAEGPLTGKRVVFNKWAARPFQVYHEPSGKEVQFLSIDQYDVLAILGYTDGGEA